MKGCKSQFKNRKLLGFSSGSGSPTGFLPFPEKVPRGEMMWEEPSQLIPFASLEMIGRARPLILIGQMRMEQRAKAATMETPPVTMTMT